MFPIIKMQSQLWRNEITGKNAKYCHVGLYIIYKKCDEWSNIFIVFRNEVKKELRKFWIFKQDGGYFIWIVFLVMDKKKLRLFFHFPCQLLNSWCNEKSRSLSKPRMQYCKYEKFANHAIFGLVLPHRSSKCVRIYLVVAGRASHNWTSSLERVFETKGERGICPPGNFNGVSFFCQ